MANTILDFNEEDSRTLVEVLSLLVRWQAEQQEDSQHSDKDEFLKLPPQD